MNKSQFTGAILVAGAMMASSGVCNDIIPSIRPSSYRAPKTRFAKSQRQRREDKRRKHAAGFKNAFKKP